VFATWVICPAFSASVIFERQSAVEMQPAAVVDAVDVVVTDAAGRATRMKTAMSSALPGVLHACNV